MALITSAATGNFSAGATWTGGVVPTTGDEARASTGHTITIDVNTTCDEVSNAGTGIFTLADGVTLTANVTNKSTTTSRNCVQFTAASPATATIVGNIQGGTVSGSVGVSNTSSGSLTINGNATNQASGGSSVLNVSTGSITLTGNCTGTVAAYAVANSAGGTVTITGNVSTLGASNASTGAITITGTVTAGGSGTFGAANSAGGTVTITGNVTGGSASGATGVNNGGVGTVTITGNSTGGSVAGATGSNNASTGTLTLIGSAIASSTSIGANNASTGILSVKRAVGNAYGIGAAGGTLLAYGINSAAIGSDSRAEELEYGENGAAPTNGAVKIVAASNNKCIVELTSSAQKTLADPSDGTGQAAEADVRSGTVYALGNLTGTCAVPAASSVAFGVSVDATTGTAALTPAAVWDALTSGMTTSGSIGARLKNAATVDTTGQSLADALTPAP